MLLPVDLAQKQHFVDKLRAQDRSDNTNVYDQDWKQQNAISEHYLEPTKLVCPINIGNTNCTVLESFTLRIPRILMRHRRCLRVRDRRPLPL